MAMGTRKPRPSFYGVTITDMVVLPIDKKGRRDYRVYWSGEHGPGNALMRPSANPESLRPGAIVDVIRNGNGRILQLRRHEDI